MKKLIILAMLFTLAATMISCAGSRRTGCPMSERIIH